MAGGTETGPRTKLIQADEQQIESWIKKEPVFKGQGRTITLARVKLGDFGLQQVVLLMPRGMTLNHIKEFSPEGQTLRFHNPELEYPYDNANPFVINDSQAEKFLTADVAQDLRVTV